MTSEQEEIVKEQKYGDLEIKHQKLDNSFQKIAQDLKAKKHPNGKIYLRVRDSEDNRRWNEFSLEVGGE